MSDKQPENRAVAIREEHVNAIMRKVHSFQQAGELHLPANYSSGNALNSAWLILQGVKDKNDKPALSVCTPASIANSLLDMVIQGLNPAKKQCYFIVYGTTLTMQRSYFGTMSVAKQVDERIDDIYATVVYEGDEFEYEIRRGKKYVTKHVQKLANVNPEKITAAYCQILFKDGSEDTDIMTIAQIKKSWMKSKMNPDGANSTHSQFSEEMARKTIINRACKNHINSSSDKNLMQVQAFERTDEEKEELFAQATIDANANQGIIDIDPEPQQAAEQTTAAPVNGAGEAKQEQKGGPDF